LSLHARKSGSPGLYFPLINKKSNANNIHFVHTEYIPNPNAFEPTSSGALQCQLRQVLQESQPSLLLLNLLFAF